MKPVIGITCNFDWRWHKYCLAESYVRSIESAGGLALLLPCCTQKPVPEICNLLDGVLLSGGGDVDPAYFGEEPHCGLQEVVPQRDCWEIELVHWAIEAKVPLLAICRGLQILNIAAGGTIWQDIAAMNQTKLQHNQQAARNVVSHSISVTYASRLARICADQQTVKADQQSRDLNFRVNSMHHQAIKKVAPGYVKAAVAADGLIEAIEKEDGQFVIGVQWHPECLTENNRYAQRLFREFVTACKL